MSANPLIGQIGRLADHLWALGYRKNTKEQLRAEFQRGHDEGYECGRAIFE